MSELEGSSGKEFKGRKRIDSISGYRFKPKDEELILDYLMRKVHGLTLPMDDIHYVDLYSCDPDNLTANFPKVGDDEWYFFTPRDRKYHNGSRPSRSTPTGYWKATGVAVDIFNTRDLDIVNPIGKKRTLVYYVGAPNDKNAKTSWTMQEYTLIGERRTRLGPNDMRAES
ncbi:hypothetical protein M569_09876 [Genlisea aurea]|uniref:NAC domain-containing protein n=1 Tax=Genlisea aurea TaxID=192259 RepID=S8DY83_9LAMI|nr:hypothetical protein M569_09876 [Genlisea aurea]